MNSDVDRQFLNAARVGDLSTLVCALKNGANPLAENDPGWSALHVAAYRGHARLLPTLIGAIDAALPLASAKQAALFLAAGEGHAACVELLLPLSDARAKNDSGETALMRAAANGHAECVRLLLPVSDPLAVDRGFGRSALFFAMASDAPGALDCFELLAPVSDLVSCPLEGDFARPHASSPLRFAVSAALTRDRQGQTEPRRQALAMIRTLILLGADTQAPNAGGVTVFDLAAAGGNMLISRCFRDAILERDRLAIAAAADAALRDGSGRPDGAEAPRKPSLRV
jgi:hypothetical protein